MRLADLEPYFHKMSAEGYLIPVEHLDERIVAVDFVCPGCIGKLWAHRVFAPRAGAWPHGGSVWTYTGTSFEDLSFVDSPTGSRSVRVRGGCGSHFNVVQGAIEFYDDSQHASYHPADRFNLENAPAEPDHHQPGENAVTEQSSDTYADVVPDGYVRTGVLKYENGILYQLHCAPYEGPQPQKVFVSVPGTATPPGLLNFFEQQLAPLRAELDALKMRVAQIEQAWISGLAPITAPPQPKIVPALATTTG